MRLGERVRERREALGLTLKALARAMGINYSYLCRIERGQRLPTLEYIPRLALWLGITEMELISAVEQQRILGKLSKLTRQLHDQPRGRLSA
jgi:transcriptional regulator with XRE-family HTH domain